MSTNGLTCTCDAIEVTAKCPACPPAADQTPATDSERDERLREARVLAAEVRADLPRYSKVGRSLVALDDEVTRLTALLAEQAATIERVREVADKWVKTAEQHWSCDNDDVRAFSAEVILDALGSQRTEGQG